MDAAFSEYYTNYEKYLKPGPQVPRRLMAPRLPRHNLDRGSWALSFPVDRQTWHILARDGKLGSKYMFFTHFIIAESEGGKPFECIDDFSELERILIKYAIHQGIPIIGTAVIEAADDPVAHSIAYLLRRDPGNPLSLEVALFETYDTTAEMKKGRQWAETIVPHFLEIYKSTAVGEEHQAISPGNAESIVHSDENLQQGEGECGPGQCVMWSLIFLACLRDIPDLKTASYRELHSVYDIMRDKNKLAGLKREAYINTAAGRRKTFKNRVRSSHNVRRKTIRKSISGIRRRIRSGFKHRRRRV